MCALMRTGRQKVESGASLRGRHPGRPIGRWKESSRPKHFPRDFSPRPAHKGLLPAKASCVCALGVRCFSKKFQPCFLFTFCVLIPMVLPCPQQDEGEEQKCCEESAREGKRRVFGAGQAAAAAVGHHQSTGQSVHHPPHHQLPQNETRLSRWWVCAYTRLIFFLRAILWLMGKNLMRVQRVFWKSHTCLIISSVARILRSDYKEENITMTFCATCMREEEIFFSKRLSKKEKGINKQNYEI